MTTQHAIPDQVTPRAALCGANLLVGGMPGQGKAHAQRTVLLLADYVCPMTGTTTCDGADARRCPAC